MSAPLQSTATGDSVAISVEGLNKTFPTRRGVPDVVAVDDLSFSVEYGRTLGIVGESGSGKSTVARCILGLTPVDSGTVEVLGRSIVGAPPRALRSWRSEMQIVFQEPYESLDPRYHVWESVAEPLLLHTDLRGAELSGRVHELLEQVALSADLAGRYPHELSGGQQQRVNIARALATSPRVLVLDEPTASLDVSVQEGVLQLLLNLQQELNLTYVLISHDLKAIRAVCERVAVMYLGRLVEIGPTDEVLSNPKHPYTEFLIGAELSVDPDVAPAADVVRGEVSSTERPAGCVFEARCPLAVEACGEAQPPLIDATPGHAAACIFVTNEHPATKSTTTE
jgi:oligopeptide/dipeptide ABC transporter ATP-binding protein